MTPTQLRAFAAVVRLGSVKEAAVDLEVSEAAVSLHIGQLRKELGDRLFVRTASGLAFTPGGLRLASRAAEMLGPAGPHDPRGEPGRRAAGGCCGSAASSLFAEHAAPGLIELFASRADDLDVELSVHGAAPVPPRCCTPARSTWRSGRGRTSVDDGDRLHAVPQLPSCSSWPAPDHPLAARPGVASASCATRPGCSARRRPPTAASIPQLLRRIGVPEDRQRIFQSDAAALEEAKRSKGVALALVVRRRPGPRQGPARAGRRARRCRPRAPGTC